MPFHHKASLCILLLIATGCQTPRTHSLPSVQVRPAPMIQFRGAHSATPDKPGECDSNCPSHWDDDVLYVFNSAQRVWRLSGPDIAHLDRDYRETSFNNKVGGGRWIEATWKEGAILYGWYHWEPTGICPGKQPKAPDMCFTAPRIGAAKSTDNGATWEDLGVVLETPPDTDRCDTKNYYFVGGNGDFSVMLDQKKQYLYFFISTYPQQTNEQGVAIARMAWTDRNHPVGSVKKWHAGTWNEPGVGGHVTPIFKVGSDWHEKNPDAFWGPSVHWNTHLKQYVMLLNRAKDENWGQEGIYITYATDLANPTSWSQPQRILEGGSWYPVAMGLEKGGTDKLAGQRARLFVAGKSEWEILFTK